MKKLIIILLLINSMCYGQVQLFMPQKDTSLYDPNAEAFFAAYSITNIIQKNAINTFVLAAKSHGYWTLLTEIYPFVGGTSTKHAGNLKSPGTHNLVFTGGTHSATGWDGNGTDDADVGISHSTVNTSAFTAVVYSREDVDELGALYGAGAEMEMLPNLGGVFYSDIGEFDGGANRLTVSTSFNTAAMFTITLTASLTHTAYRNATSIGTRTMASVNYSNSLNIKLSSWGGGRYSTRQICFAAFSTTTGLTSGQQTDLYNDVQAMETTLSRNN